jgi:hypothetical protein
MLVVLQGSAKLCIVDLATGKTKRSFYATGVVELTPMQQLAVAKLKASVAPGHIDESLTAEKPSRLLFSPDGNLLFCATDAAVWVYAWQDLLAATKSNPKPLHYFPVTQPTSHPFGFLPIHRSGNRAFALAYDESRNSLLAGCGNGTVRRFNLATGAASTLLTIPGGSPVLYLVLSTNGAFLATLESGVMKGLQSHIASLLGGRTGGLADDSPDRLLIWDYRKLSSR